MTLINPNIQESNKLNFKDESYLDFNSIKGGDIRHDWSLEEIKENLTINTNTLSKPSIEQLINQAFKFHSQGNISEAAKYYQYFINQGFKDHRVFSNYGSY